MPDPVRDVLLRADDPDPGFGAAELAGWPPGAADRLEAAGLLAETTPATSAACEACGADHVEPVVWVDGPRGPRAFVPCPTAGRSAVDPGHFRRWVVRVAGLAQAVAGAAGPVTDLPHGTWTVGMRCILQ